VHTIPMSTSTLTLANVETAIATVLQHQRYKLMDRDFTFADLETLMEFRDKLIGEEAMTNGAFGVARFSAIGG